MRRFAVMILLVFPLFASGQQSPAPDATLAQARQRLLEDVARMPRYTCVQTIYRQYFNAPLHAPKTCSGIITEHDKRTHELTLNQWDRLRLDVVVGGSGEIYTWVGGQKLETATIKQLAGSGAFGSGDFGPFLNAIFRVATVKFEKQTAVDGRTLFEYSYEVPETLSHYQVMKSDRSGWLRAAYRGAFLLDPQSSDLVQITLRTAELSQETKACQAITEVDYHRLPLRGSQALIPQQTRLRVIGRAGEETLNVTSYGNCHEFGSESVLHLNPGETNPADAREKPAPDPRTPIPPGLGFALRITTPLDSETSAAGDPLEAVLRSPIRNRHGDVLAPVGAHLHGRLRSLGYSSRDQSIFIAIIMESIDLNGTTIPISMVVDPDATPGIGFSHNTTTPGSITSAGGGALLYHGTHFKAEHLDAKGLTTSPANRD